MDLLGLSRFYGRTCLFGADHRGLREDAGVDRLSKMKLTPQSTLDADRNLKLISERSPYMRTER